MINVKKILLVIGIALILTTGLGVLGTRFLFNSREDISGNLEPMKVEEVEVINSEAPQEEKTVGIGIGNIAPSFTLENIFGEKESLEDYRGKKIVLNFFRTT